MTHLAALPLASFKLRFEHAHVRAVPAKTEEGCAFAGPGVDLLGDEARAVLAMAAPLLAWFEAREPGVRLRSLSCDLRTGRVLATTAESEGRPRVVRVDPPQSDEIVRDAGPLILHLGGAARDKLRQRGR